TIEDYICSSACDAGDTGRDNYYGAGILDMEQAMVRAVPIALNAVQLQPSELNLNLGDCYQMEVAFYPQNASNCEVSWSSDDETVAVVNAEGKVLAVGAGRCHVIACSEDGGKTSSSLVSVVNPAGSGGFIIWEPAVNVDSTHRWTVCFSQPLDISSINSNNVFITDRQGNLQTITFIIDENGNGKVLTAVPVKAFNSGERYSLWVRNLKDTNSAVLDHGVKMDFTIAGQQQGG
ncbi:MAG: Ig-like domain-containing protein, partial [Syntrophomonas sp.]